MGGHRPETRQSMRGNKPHHNEHPTCIFCMFFVLLIFHVIKYITRLWSVYSQFVSIGVQQTLGWRWATLGLFSGGCRTPPMHTWLVLWRMTQIMWSNETPLATVALRSLHEKHFIDVQNIHTFTSFNFHDRKFSYLKWFNMHGIEANIFVSSACLC